jgi:lipid II:glycine glycyltransferase (peptidoglycan interpeptide bridge formation enzyme)
MSDISFELVSDPAEWDNLIFKHKQTFQHFAQWENVKSATWAFERYKFGDYPIQIAIKKGFKGLFKLGYIAPLNPEDLSHGLLKAIKAFSKKEKFDSLIIETMTEDPMYLNMMKDIGYGKYFSEVQPRDTNIIDMTKTEDEIFAELKGKYRREIRKATKDGYVVTTYNSGTKGVDQFYEIISSVVGRGNFTTYKKDYFQKMFDAMSFDEKNVEVHIIHKQETPDKPLGAYLVLYDQETAYELYGGTNIEGRKNRVGFLLKWESINKAKEHFVKRYDQWGIAKRDSNGEYIKTHPLYNVSVFKKGYGGADVTFIPTMVIVNSKLKYAVYRIAMALKPLFLEILKLKK